MSRSLVLLLLLVACEGPRPVAVRVSIPGLDSTETPVPNLEVIALPYDRDSVLAQLAGRAPTPRPATAPLDSVFAEFRGPFAAYSAAAYRAAKLRDSVAAMRARLDSLPADAADYQPLRARAAVAAESLRAVEARRDRARVALDAARDTFVRRSDSLRRTVRDWEDSTYRGWDSLVRGLAAVRRADPRADTTDATGWAQFSLPPGAWWIYARSWDAADPNAEWYWNVPADRDTVMLSSETARHQPRY